MPVKSADGEELIGAGDAYYLSRDTSHLSRTTPRSWSSAPKLPTGPPSRWRHATWPRSAEAGPDEEAAVTAGLCSCRPSVAAVHGMTRGAQRGS
jgi:hypothetical protein